MRLSSFFFKSKISDKCQAIASPSRSSSLASITSSAFLAASLNSLTTLVLSLETMYFGAKSCSISILNLLFGKSRT